MNLYPAIDIYQGKVVRLTQGDYNSRVVYSTDPVATAKEWESEGASWIHVVDLEGAKTGSIAVPPPCAEVFRAPVYLYLGHSQHIPTIMRVRSTDGNDSGRIV